jgi:hypothetical protein
MELLYISYSLYLLLSITGVALLVILFGWLLYKYYRFLLRSSFLGYSLQIRLINIAITAIIFGSAVKALFIKPVMLLFAFIKLLVDNISVVSKKKGEIKSPYFVDLFNKIYAEISNFLTDDFLRIDLFLALAFMAGLTLFINKVFYSKDLQQYQLPTIKGIRPLQQNLFLFILMAFSLFLVLSAMIAIPVIDKPKDFSTANPARYDSLLSNIKDAKANVASQHAYALPDTSFMDSIKKVFDAAGALPFKRADILNTLSRDKETVLSYLRNTIDLIGTVNERHNKAIKDFEDMKNGTFEDIQFKLREKSSRLSFGREEEYYLYLVSWYSGTLKRSIDFFKARKTQLEGLGNDLRNKANEVINKWPGYRDTLTTLDNSSLNIPKDYFNLATAQIPYDDFSSSVLVNTYFVQQSGKRRTLFENVGDWLANTNSMDIVLIIGMFGFGLLGAAISSFITARREALRDPTTPLVDNLSVVIIRGFSAAIVIFLATKGSIAVINNGSNDPNPYVLFFACIVGAVYSERIWDWAKDRISSTYKTEAEQAAAAAAAAIPPAAPPAPLVPAVVVPPPPPPGMPPAPGQ